MTKSPDAFRTISEVADWLGIQAYVLRFWESKFTQVKPVKRAGGRRYYRPSDMILIGGIKKLLHDDGLTIKGVQKILREQGITHVSSLSQSLDETAAIPQPVIVDPTLDDANDTVVAFSDAVRAPQSAAPEQIDLDLASRTEPEVAQTAATSVELLPELDEIEDLDATDSDVAQALAGEQPDELVDDPEPDNPDSPPPARLIPQVDLADPLPDEQIEFSPGPLAQLAEITALDKETAAELADLAAALTQLNSQKNNVTAE